MKLEQTNPTRYPTPSREDYFDFFVRCYFGEGADLLLLCVRRAYRDFNRHYMDLPSINMLTVCAMTDIGASSSF
jgi:hypothetical protein